MAACLATKAMAEVLPYLDQGEFVPLVVAIDVCCPDQLVTTTQII